MREKGDLHHDPKAPVGESLGPVFWAKARLNRPKPAPKSVHLKLDPEVFEFFKSQGKGHLTKMQEVLKAYVEAHR
ncbi:BrnA antitoxin family protein [Jiella avicenniae]|uniref:BrnA antitoxin family protein n=1 Tax=Jiella avicenniae TaxID=2907202 RepID=A0A9X1NZX9_9HYPH|nr:BrnA antitoxin family protein [Jiella avicenniae]MCE7027785.1 BrnA antitoxin family protein [Jiella avicenniae]